MSEEIKRQDHEPRGQEVNNQIDQGENERQIEESSFRFFFDLGHLERIRLLVPEESQDGILNSVLEQDHENVGQRRKEKKRFPTPLSEEEISLGPKELKRREGIENGNHDKSKQIGSQVPDIEAEERRSYGTCFFRHPLSPHSGRVDQ
jgi:hypothetical protein